MTNLKSIILGYSGYMKLLTMKNTIGKTLFVILITLIVLSFTMCYSGGGNKRSNTESDKKETQKPTGFAPMISSVFRIDTYDQTRILENGIGFFVTEELAVSRMSFLKSANRAIVEPFDEEKGYDVLGFTAVDRSNDLILLKIDGLNRTPINLRPDIIGDLSKSSYFDKPQGNTVPVHNGKILSYSTVLGTNIYRVSNSLRSKSAGSPVFDTLKNCIGLIFMEIDDYEKQTFVTPSTYIKSLIEKSGKLRPLSELESQEFDPHGEQNSKIKGLLIETDLGNIQIKLHNSTPQYRDNFIKLVRENYYDGLLIHRIIKGFGIQGGAADTRYAGPDDVVGWKGPGYTLPAHFVKGMYHKRGVIGSPRKPETDNSRKRSDGSQFYIVTGRKYADPELDELEKEMHHKFTAEQRLIYNTIGGSPHLDGDYTIFGEVTSGIEVADKISNLEVKNGQRPKNDVRIKKIRIIE